MTENLEKKFHRVDIYVQFQQNYLLSANQFTIALFWSHPKPETSPIWSWWPFITWASEMGIYSEKDIHKTQGAAIIHFRQQTRAWILAMLIARWYLVTCCIQITIEMVAQEQISQPWISQVENHGRCPLFGNVCMYRHNFLPICCFINQLASGWMIYRLIIRAWLMTMRHTM